MSHELVQPLIEAQESAAVGIERRGPGLVINHLAEEGTQGALAELDLFLDRLRNQPEAERLVAEAIGLVRSALGSVWVTAWLFDDLRPGLHRLTSVGLPATAALPEVLPEALASAFPAHMDLDAPVGAGMPAQILPVAEVRRGGPEMEEVRRLDAHLLLTLPGGHLVQGILLLGPRASGRSYDDASRSLLLRLGVELGRALAAANRSPAGLLPADSRVKTPPVFVPRLEEELARAERFQRAVTVIWVALDIPAGLLDHEVNALVDAVGSWLGATLRVMDTVGKRPDCSIVAVLPETSRPGAELLRKRLAALSTEQAFGLTRAIRTRLKLRLGLATYPEDGVSSRFLLLAAERDSVEFKLEGDPAAVLAAGEVPRLPETLVHGVAPVASSTRMREVLELARRVASSKLTVLVTGETGVGKERIAEYIHHCSDRRTKAEVRLNCSAIPETMIEAEFFGFERGSFTGALRSTRGKFELADGGTLFLDEIGELSLSMQVKLLRVLDEQRFYRLGAAVPTQVDVRVIAITNRDLSVEVGQGRFREDLFYRLNVVTLKIPALRERPEDIPPLVDRLIGEFCERSGLPPKKLALEAYDLLYGYPWRGNVRELRNVIERSVVVAGTPYITGEDLIRAVPDLTAARSAGQRSAARPLPPQAPSRTTVGQQREQGVLDLLRRRPDIGLQDILREVGASKSTGIRLINELISRGQVVRRNRGKRSRYRLVETSDT